MRDVTLGNDNRTDKQTDRQSATHNAAPPREEGRIITDKQNSHQPLLHCRMCSIGLQLSSRSWTTVESKSNRIVVTTALVLTRSDTCRACLVWKHLYYDSTITIMLHCCWNSCSCSWWLQLMMIRMMMMMMIDCRVHQSVNQKHL